MPADTTKILTRDSFIDAPVKYRTKRLAVCPEHKGHGQFSTVRFTVIHIDSGYALGRSIRGLKRVIKLVDDIVAQCPDEEMADKSWKNKPSWAILTELHRAAEAEGEADKPQYKQLRERGTTPRLDANGNYTKRWFELMPFDVPRWIRCYDNGGETADRYTVVYSGLKNKSREHYYRGMSTNPSHPQGYGIFGSTMYKPLDDPFTPGARSALGKQIVFADLPDECQMVVLSDYCELWHLTASDHPAWEPELGIFFINPNPEAWHPLRPFKGQHDSRQQQCYWDEKRAMAPESLADLIGLAGYEPPLLEDMQKWGWNDRMEVVKWCSAVVAVANDHGGKVPPTPRVMQMIVGDKVMAIPQQQQGD